MLRADSLKSAFLTAYGLLFRSQWLKHATLGYMSVYDKIMYRWIPTSSR